jgi:transposase
MQNRDGRSIPDAALEVLRERAVAMHEAGNTQLAIAAALGVHKNTVHQWLKGWRVAGAAALKAKKRGRRHEAQRLLDAGQAAEVQRLMTENCPDQLDLPHALWGREAVRELARARFGVRLALRTVSDYLRRWGFTPQRPVKRALERQDAAIQAWLAEHYPRIAARAKAEGAVIHWGDETGISNQPVHGRSFAPKGQTPVLRRPATRRTLSMISAVTNRGTLRFMLYEGALNAGLFLIFLQRLVRGARGKVFLIVDNPEGPQGRQGPGLGGRAPGAARAGLPALPAGLCAGAQSGRVPAQRPQAKPGPPSRGEGQGGAGEPPARLPAPAAAPAGAGAGVLPGTDHPLRCLIPLFSRRISS